MEKNKARGSIILQTVIYIKAIGQMIPKMDQVLLIIVMEIPILVFGAKTKKMEMEYTSQVLVMSTKDNIKTIKDMVMVQCIFQMVLIIMENGLMV